MPRNDEHDHCEGCGIRLAKLPEDATPEEMLCDSCLAKKGKWSSDDLRRAFVMGARWWLWKTSGATPFPSEYDEMEAEAERQYPQGRARDDA